jgi:hypothetical protein
MKGSADLAARRITADPPDEAIGALTIEVAV